MTILAYFADILYTNGSRAGRWLTPYERARLVGDATIATATYSPLVRQIDGIWLTAPAWLIETAHPQGAYVTASREAAMSAWQIGGQVTPLQFVND